MAFFPGNEKAARERKKNIYIFLPSKVNITINFSVEKNAILALFIIKLKAFIAEIGLLAVTRTRMYVHNIKIMRRCIFYVCKLYCQYFREKKLSKQTKKIRRRKNGISKVISVRLKWVFGERMLRYLVVGLKLIRSKQPSPSHWFNLLFLQFKSLYVKIMHAGWKTTKCIYKCVHSFVLNTSYNIWNTAFVQSFHNDFTIFIQQLARCIYSWYRCYSKLTLVHKHNVNQYRSLIYIE